MDEQTEELGEQMVDNSDARTDPAGETAPEAEGQESVHGEEAGVASALEDTTRRVDAAYFESTGEMEVEQIHDVEEAAAGQLEVEKGTDHQGNTHEEEEETTPGKKEEIKVSDAITERQSPGELVDIDHTEITPPADELQNDRDTEGMKAPATSNSVEMGCAVPEMTDNAEATLIDDDVPDQHQEWEAADIVVEDKKAVEGVQGGLGMDDSQVKEDAKAEPMEESSRLEVIPAEAGNRVQAKPVTEMVKSDTAIDLEVWEVSAQDPHLSKTSEDSDNEDEPALLQLPTKDTRGPSQLAIEAPEDRFVGDNIILEEDSDAEDVIMKASEACEHESKELLSEAPLQESLESVDGEEDSIAPIATPSDELLALATEENIDLSTEIGEQSQIGFETPTADAADQGTKYGRRLTDTADISLETPGILDIKEPSSNLVRPITGLTDLRTRQWPLPSRILIVWGIWLPFRLKRNQFPLTAFPRCMTKKVSRR